MILRQTFWQHLGIQRFMLGECQHEIKVTYLGGGVYGCRVFTNGVLNAENRCRGKAGISAACRDLLRWESKMGNWSDFSDAPAIHYNWVMKKWYCTICARKINEGIKEGEKPLCDWPTAETMDEKRNKRL